MSGKTLTLLGFASKAGKLSFGARAALDAVNRKKSKLLVTASDVSNKSKKEVSFVAGKHGVPVKTLDVDMQTLSRAVGRTCGVLSVNDPQFADSIFLQEETK